MAPEQLRKQAHVIVAGRVLEVSKDGPMTRDQSHGWQRHVALVKAGKIHKGKLEDQTFRLKYRTRVENNKRWGGGVDSYSFRARQRCKFHLKRSRDRKGKVHHHLFNWAGLERHR